MEQLLEQPKKVKKDYEKLEQSTDEYLHQNFKLVSGESLVKYCKVGANNFRINFYKKREVETMTSDYYISRSYYVILIKTKNGWSHKVLED